MAIRLSNQYKQPRGYDYSPLIRGASRYKPFNGYVGGGVNYAPNPSTLEQLTLTFSAAPVDGSSIRVQVHPSILLPPEIWVFTYGGSPGDLIIPLVSGGGTAAQAATATATALNGDSTVTSTWTVTNPSAGLVVMTSKIVGFSPTLTTFGTTHITIGTQAATQGVVLPGRFGKNYCFMPGTLITPGG